MRPARYYVRSMKISCARDLAAARAEGISSLRDPVHAWLSLFRRTRHARRRSRDDLGFAQVSTSHETVPLIKYVSRGDTTVADAYLSPVLDRYSQRIAHAIGTREEGPRLFFMMSNGGLAAPKAFHGKDAVLSGPAGGVVGMAEPRRSAGFDHVIGFDMGGTSTDVSRFDGIYERSHDNEVAGVRLRVPMMAIHTIAAGGGSILHFDGARFRVGPDSAGSIPGPMSYRGGGPLTVTDANVMTGKLQPENFPRIFGGTHDQPLDELRVRRLFAELAAQTGAAPRTSRTVSSALPSRTWRTRSKKFPSHVAMTRAVMRSPVSAAPAGSTRALSPTRSGSHAYSFIRSRVCYRPMACGWLDTRISPSRGG